MSACLYQVEGDAARPTGLTMGPWSASGQHGGPPAALFTALVERHLGAGENLSRIHVDLLSAVPLEPLRFDSSYERKSKRVAHVVVRLLHDERVVAQATALLTQTSGAPEPQHRTEPDKISSPHDLADADPPAWWSPAGSTPFHSHAVAHRFVSGAFDRPGPAVDWIRLKVPVIDGADPTAAQRIAAVSDLGSGISAVFGPDAGFGMINTDLNISFVGRPVGEWFCLVADSIVSNDGTGLATARVFDESARLVAVTTQSLLGLYLS